LKKQLNDYVKLVKEYSASKDKLTNDINDLKNENKKLLESISKLKKIIIKLETSSGNKNVVDIKKLIKQILLEKESKKIEDKMKDMDINEDNIDEVINNLN